MADKDETSYSQVSRTNGGTAINKKLDLLGQKVNSLYSDIYITRPDNKQNLDSLIDNLDSALDKLQGFDTSSSGMTELLRRLDTNNNSNTTVLMNSVKELFENDNLLGTMVFNDSMHNYIAAQNYNYDLICKYLPKLEDALEIKRDNVLCSDNFSKSFINPVSRKSSKEEVLKFNNNTKKLEDEYDILDFLDETYMRTSKYGEDFIYIVPYNVAFKRLIARANRGVQNNGRIMQSSLFESYDGGHTTCCETATFKSDEFVKYMTENLASVEGEEKFNPEKFPNIGNINLYFNKSNVIQGPLNEYAIFNDKKDLEAFQSMTSIYESAAINEANFNPKAPRLDSMFTNIAKRKDAANKVFQRDGLIVNDGLKDAGKIDDNFLGAVVERIEREDIVPIYIGKKCLGYYYFEFAEDPTACGFCGGHHSTPMNGSGVRLNYDMTEAQQELTVRYISSIISASIDTKFINANKDLKEEIYQILNYNNKFDLSRTNNIGITFIPADDIVHCYFKLNEHTHRGISDLERSVTPAMLYILLYLTDIIGKITRSTDKRVYYVKQNVETNVARTMMNVVQQIKKGNMGVRAIESINNILNIVGKYNDLIIPLGPSGDPPVSMEIMQGQDINTPTEIMDKMEEAAVNPIVPMEFVNSTMQQDFAIRYTMSNTRFLKTIYTRQRKTQRFFSKIYTKIYNYEFGETNKIIEIILPPPTYLTAQNNAQLIDNTTQIADKIIDTDMVGEDDAVREEFKKLYVRDALAAYLDYDRIEQLKEAARVTMHVKAEPQTQDGEMSDIMDDEEE